MIEFVLAIFASTGFWTFVMMMVQRHDAKTNNRDKILLGLAHERICSLSEEYIKEGSILESDYESLHDYLYVPYKAVKKLPLRETK